MAETNKKSNGALGSYIDSSEEPNSRLIIINRRLAGYSTRKSVLYSYYSGSNKNYSLWEKKTQLWRLPNLTFRVAVKSKGKGTFKIHERGKIKEEETLGHFSILSPSKSDGSLAQLEWERDVWLDVNRGLPHILSSTGQSHTHPDGIRKGNQRCTSYRFGIDRLAKARSRPHPFLFSIQLDISYYREREREQTKGLLLSITANVRR